MRLLPWIIALTLAVSVTASAKDDVVNHCDDAAANEKWGKLAQAHRDEDVWQRLFALRVGLCAMVNRGQLSVDRATRIFERERMEGIEELQRSRASGKIGT